MRKPITELESEERRWARCKQEDEEGVEMNVWADEAWRGWRGRNWHERCVSVGTSIDVTE